MGQNKEKRHFSPMRRLELFLAGCLYYSGLVRLSRWWTRRSGPVLTILCYHAMSDGYLREHLLYLKRYYRVLHLEEALEELYSLPDNRKEDFRPLLVLTFDDGYRDLYTYGLPLVTELQAPITSFLVPGYIESGERFWWSEPEFLLRHTPVNEVLFQGQVYHLNDQEQRRALLQVIDHGLRYATSIPERESFVENVRSALQVPLSIELNEQERDLLPLNWEEVHELDRAPWVSFGAHTMHHPILTSLANAADLQYEVSECRTVLERQLGHAVRTFAYPVGKDEDMDANSVKAAKIAGYTWAVTALHGLNTPGTDPLFLSRIVVDVDQHWLMIAAKSSGLWDFLVRSGRSPITLLRNMFK